MSSPAKPQSDPGFRAEIERLSVRALIGLTNLVMPLLGFLFHSVVQLIEQIPAPGMWSVAVFPVHRLVAIAAPAATCASAGVVCGALSVARC